MSLPRYAEYKESGTSWIGEVPSHWIKRSLQDTARSGRNAFVDGPFGSDLKSEEYADEGIPLIQLNNVSVGKHDLTNLKFIPEKKAEELARHKATPGDIVIAKMAAPVARAAIVSSDFEQFVIVADCVKLSVDASRWNAKFLQYWINSAGVNAVAETLSAGITRLRINLGSLKKLPVFLTPLSEQTAIATFLDRETGKIDALIAEQEKLLALLAEKRQATIFHAVTKGLNPNAPIKDSGLEWAGVIPEDWVVSRLGLFASVENGTTPSRQNEDYWTNGEVPWLASGEVNQLYISEATEFITEKALNECSLRLLSAGTIIVGMIGQGKTRGMSAMLTLAACINQNLAAICPGPRLISMYVLYVFHAIYEWLREAGRGGNQAAMNCQMLSALRIPIPPLAEQTAIAAFIDSEIAKLDALKIESELAISLLKERRSALCAAAVTGQIDVRGLVTEPEAA